MILQAIEDFKYRFIDVFAGFPGSIHDSHVFSYSNHQLLVNNGKKLNGATIDIQCVKIYEFIIGDARYMASQNIFVPQSG